MDWDDDNAFNFDLKNQSLPKGTVNICDRTESRCDFTI